MGIVDNIRRIEETLSEGVTLVAVSKTKPVEDILEAYRGGQRIFGENKVQEMCTKHEQLPQDIQWHLIGHLQSNKVKYIVPFVAMIHSIDSLELLRKVTQNPARFVLKQHNNRLAMTVRNVKDIEDAYKTLQQL